MQHRGLVFLEPRPRDEWGFERDGKSVRVKLEGFMTSNFGAALSTAAAAGAGLVVAPSFVTRPDIMAGRLELVFVRIGRFFPSSGFTPSTPTAAFSRRR